MNLVIAALALSTTLKEATFEEVAARADTAARVRVLGSSARWEGGRIVTDSYCEVLDAAFGADVGSEIIVTTLGGFVGDIGQRVDGLERPMPGDELALLLGRDGYMHGGKPLVGFSYGLYKVVRADSQRFEEAPIIGFAAGAAGVARDAAGPPMTWGEFAQRAKQARQP